MSTLLATQDEVAQLVVPQFRQYILQVMATRLGLSLDVCKDHLRLPAEKVAMLTATEEDLLLRLI